MDLQKLVHIFIIFIGNLILVEAKEPCSISTSKWNAGLRISTLGVQGEIGFRFNKTFSLRVQSGGFIHKLKTFDFGGVSYHNVEIKPQTII